MILRPSKIGHRNMLSITAGKTAIQATTTTSGDSREGIHRSNTSATAATVEAMAEAGVAARAAAANGMAEAAEVGAGAEAAAETESGAAGAPSGQRPKPANRESMIEAQRETWTMNTQARAKGQR